MSLYYGKDIVLRHLQMVNIRISNEFVCTLKHLNYGAYLEDILTRIMKGEEVDSSFLSNHYVPREKREQKVV